MHAHARTHAHAHAHAHAHPRTLTRTHTHTRTHTLTHAHTHTHTHMDGTECLLGWTRVVSRPTHLDTGGVLMHFVPRQTNAIMLQDSLYSMS
jgi:hypothetical protein